MIKKASKLIKRAHDYTEEMFEQDFQVLLDSYNDLPEIKLSDIRDEINNWDFSVDQQTLMEFDTVCESYAKFVAYQNRIVKVMDSINSHKNLLEFVIQNIKEIGSQLYQGTAKDKDAKILTMLLPISLFYNEISSLASYVQATQKSIEFNSQQLARILREREAIARVNNSAHNTGLYNKYNKDISVNTKNKIK